MTMLLFIVTFGVVLRAFFISSTIAWTKRSVFFSGSEQRKCHASENAIAVERISTAYFKTFRLFIVFCIVMTGFGCGPIFYCHLVECSQSKNAICSTRLFNSMRLCALLGAGYSSVVLGASGFAFRLAPVAAHSDNTRDTAMNCTNAFMASIVPLLLFPVNPKHNTCVTVVLPPFVGEAQF